MFKVRESMRVFYITNTLPYPNRHSASSDGMSVPVLMHQRYDRLSASCKSSHCSETTFADRLSVRQALKGTEKINYPPPSPMVQLASRSSQHRQRSVSNKESHTDSNLDEAHHSHPNSSPCNSPIHTARLMVTRKNASEHNPLAKIKLSSQCPSNLSPARALSLPARPLVPRLARAPNASTPYGSDSNHAKLPQRPVSIADCLIALRNLQDDDPLDDQRGNAKSVAGDDSTGGMPSLVSYDQLSTFSRQSYSSCGSGISSSSASVDASLVASESLTRVISSAPRSSPSVQDDSRDNARDYSKNVSISSHLDTGKSSRFAVDQTLVSAPPSSEWQHQGSMGVSWRQPQQQPRQQHNHPQLRSLLKLSAKDYRPDILPRREMRWKTSEESNTQAGAVVEWNRVRNTSLYRSDTDSTGTNSPPDRYKFCSSMMIHPPQRRTSLSSITKHHEEKQLARTTMRGDVIGLN